MTIVYFAKVVFHEHLENPEKNSEKVMLCELRDKNCFDRQNEASQIHFYDKIAHLKKIMNLLENLLTMFKLCHKVPDNDIQGFVPYYIIKDDEYNELMKAQQSNEWKQTEFGKSEESCLESDSQEWLQRLWWGSETNKAAESRREKGSDQSEVF